MMLPFGHNKRSRWLTQDHSLDLSSNSGNNVGEFVGCGSLHKSERLSNVASGVTLQADACPCDCAVSEAFVHGLQLDYVCKVPN